MTEKLTETLSYSPLIDTVYYHDKDGNKTDVKHKFIQAMLLWINQGENPPVGSIVQRELTVGEVVHWKITCERVTE